MKIKSAMSRMNERNTYLLEMLYPRIYLQIFSNLAKTKQPFFSSNTRIILSFDGEVKRTSLFEWFVSIFYYFFSILQKAIHHFKPFKSCNWALTICSKKIDIKPIFSFLLLNIFSTFNFSCNFSEAIPTLPLLD